MDNQQQQQQTSIEEKQKNALSNTTCMELALEGERCCKSGDLEKGIKYFEKAIEVGTNDNKTLSAIYSQLGNAYFYLEDFAKALEYHTLDVALMRTIGDDEAEAKACGNLGNTLKMIDKFDDAAAHCLRSLEISRKLNDSDGIARALYNLGNVYHTLGKRMIGSAEQEPGELSIDIKDCLEKAIDYYEQNLDVVSKLTDYPSMGRAYGNLGNTHYLLGNFEEAVKNHTERLKLAKKTNEKSAQRRAYLNLGNANVFLGNFQEAVKNYTETLKLAQELQDKYTEAHSCYSLANTYTFLRDYQSAIKYHLSYIDMIKGLDDKLGQGRACWSLVNLYQKVNNPEAALIYAQRHYKVAGELGDKVGQDSAKSSIDDLLEIIEQKKAVQNALAASTSSSGGPQSSGSNSQLSHQSHHHHYGHHHHHLHSPGASGKLSNKKFNADFAYSYKLAGQDKWQDQVQRNFKKQLNTTNTIDIDGSTACRSRLGKSGSNEKLFDMIAHFQSGRINDQRCEMHAPSIASTIASKSSSKTAKNTNQGKENLESKNSNAFIEPTESINSPKNPSHSNIIPSSLSSVSNSAVSMLKATYRKASLAYPASTNQVNAQYHSQRRPTSVTIEHQDQLFELIAGVQGQRMDEQRASLPVLTIGNGYVLSKSSQQQQASSKSIQIENSVAVSKSRPPTKSNHENQVKIPARQERTRSVGNALIPTILEDKPLFTREKSHSIAPQSFLSTLKLAANSKNKKVDGTKHNPSMKESSQKSNQREDNFLDSLMKYQSNRFNDQRSEISIPKNDTIKAGGKGEDEFMSLICKFQSDRIDEQRSVPPSIKTNLVQNAQNQI